MFIADSASHSMKEYQESNGDVDVSATSWELDKDGVYARTLEFKHAVNIPVAPPFARARKEQRFRRYGPYGLSLETDTYVQDIPLATCFYVADRVLVEPNGNGQVVVHAKFDVRFVKKIMFQSLTASHTGKKFVEGFQNLEQYWSAALISSSPETLAEMQCAAARQMITVSPPPLEVDRGLEATNLVAKQEKLPKSREITRIIFTGPQCTILALGLFSFLLANACVLKM